jgi:hypothetical protein
MLNLYSSPWIGGTNSALTYGDKNGINWILEYRNAENLIARDEGSIIPYSKYYYESMTSRKFQNLKDYSPPMPSHFGYNTNSTIGDSFAYLPGRGVYMTTTEQMKLAPYSASVERRVILYAETDYIWLMNDPTAKLVYSSNEFEVWEVNIKP